MKCAKKIRIPIKMCNKTDKNNKQNVIEHYDIYFEYWMEYLNKQFTIYTNNK